MAGNAFDTRALGEALDDSVATPSTSTSQQRPPPIDVLSNDVLVSIFVALEDPDFVRRTIPLVCKAWNELYRSKDASPLHETLEVDFAKEVGKAVEAGQGVAGKSPLVHSSSVISWAKRRAGSVRKLAITGVEDGATKDFSFEEMARLVTITAPKLTELFFDFDLYIKSQVVPGELRRRRGGRYVLPDLKPFWKAVRESVASAGRLRSLQVIGADFSEKDLVRPLGRLAGSLETLKLGVFNLSLPRYPNSGDPGIPRGGLGLPHFPDFLCDLTELRSLALVDHLKIEAIPTKISSLKKLKELQITGCRLSSLPKELGELSGLTTLELGFNKLGNTPQDEAFPAELGKMKSLRHLDLAAWRRLRTVPAFVGKLESLEHLDLSVCDLTAVPAFVGELKSLKNLALSWNKNLGDAPEHRAFPAALGKMKSLRYLYLLSCDLRAVPAFVGELESLEILELGNNEKLGDAPQHSAFPAALARTKSLAVLGLHSCRLRTVPSFVGELESLEILDLAGCRLSSLPKELGELSGLTKLDLEGNTNLGNTPAAEAFPAELGKMKSLRKLSLENCGLRAVPAFIGELESLESLDLQGNDFKVDAAALAALLKGCRRLREVNVPVSPDSGELLAKLLTENTNAQKSSP